MKKIIQNIKENYRLALTVFVTGLFLGWLFFHPGEKTTVNKEVAEGHEGHDHGAEKTTIWTCSMHPQVRMDYPGKCPICGMDLIPLSSSQSREEQVNPDEIAMTESAAKLAEIQTITVTKGTPEKAVFLQGKVHADERNVAELTARFGGRIEKLFVNFTGQNVKKGEKLATIYSPDLVTAQRELLEAITFKENRPALYLAAKAKLKLWDLTDDQIAAIEERGEPQVYFDVLSPISGTVIMRYVALGDYIKEGSALFQVTDLTRVWVMFDAYESDLPWIKPGDQVDFTVQALPGKNYSAKVSYIDPFLNGATRVARVRAEVANLGLQLKPEMFVNGTIQSRIAKGSNDLLVPKSSVLWTGKRAVVYVKVPERSNPTFLYREVILGPEAGNFYVVEEGLKEGEEIATNGVFKIDAAAQLQGLPSMMNPKGGALSSGHNHGGTHMGVSNPPGDRTEHQGTDRTKKPDNISPEFKTQLTSVYRSYLAMKNAFVASDAKQARQAAKKVGKALQAVDMELLKGDAHMVWMDQLKTLNRTVTSIGRQTDIEQQRNELMQFSLALYKSIKVFGLESTTAYYQYCPMANQNKGAYWISESKAIRNPYFGKEMLECGETREILQ